MVYIADGSLRVVEIASRKERMVWRPEYDGEIGSPSFSPDGNRIVFEVGGITHHYPCEIYSIQVNGTGFRQLTHRSEPVQAQSAEGGYGGGRFFHTPRYSPDGSQISVWQFSETAEANQEDSFAVVSPDGSGFRVLGKGKPLFWADGGKAIFIAYEEGVYKYDIGSRTTTLVKHLYKDGLLGKSGRTNRFLVACVGGWLGLVTVSNMVAGPPRILPTSLVLRENAPFGNDFKLEEVSSDSSGSHLLMRYLDKNGYPRQEVLQVVRFN